MTRKEKYEELKKTYHWGRLFARLAKEEVSAMELFIETNDHLTKGDFQHVAVRRTLDKPNKEKNWVLMEEILIAVNTIAKN